MAKKKYIGAILTLKDNMSATLKGVKKEQTDFRKDVETTRKSLERTFNRKHTMKIENSTAMKIIKSTRSALDPLRQKIVTALAYKDMITRKAREVKNTLKTFGRMVFAPVVKLKDKTGAVLNKIKNSIFNLKTLVGGALAGVGIGKMLGSGAELEQQNISMEHFIGKGFELRGINKSRDEVKQLTQDYVKTLRENANLTPFETSEVIAAGTRAVTVAKGDTKEAMNLLKIAQDMAALNPKASLEDAMEALAGLQVGETQRMKAFGFQISAEDIKAAGGVESIINKQIKPFFEGGAEQLSTSGSGLWSTIKGKLSSKVQDTGLMVLDRLKPQMERAIELIDRFSPTMDLWGEKIGSGVGWALDKFGSFTGWIGQHMPAARQIIGNTSSWISEKFGWVGGEAGNLKDKFSTTFSGIGVAIEAGWGVIKPTLDLIANGVKILYDVFNLAFPYIETLVKGTWSIVEPILSKLGDALGWVADKAGKIAGWLGKKLEDRDAADNKGGTGIVSASQGIHGSHATGLKRVPFNGYIAELHKDEAVVPANQNPYLKSGSNVQNTAGLQSVLQLLQKIIQLLEEKKGDVVININGTNMTVEQIVNELIPKLKLALENM